MWIFKGFVDVIVYLTVGAFFVGFIRFIAPNLITATDAVSHMMTIGLPVLIFFCVIMLCVLAFKKRKQQAG